MIRRSGSNLAMSFSGFIGFTASNEGHDPDLETKNIKKCNWDSKTWKETHEQLAPDPLRVRSTGWLDSPSWKAMLQSFSREVVYYIWNSGHQAITHHARPHPAMTPSLDETSPAVAHRLAPMHWWQPFPRWYLKKSGSHRWWARWTPAPLPRVSGELPSTSCCLQREKTTRIGSSQNHLMTKDIARKNICAFFSSSKKLRTQPSLHNINT